MADTAGVPFWHHAAAATAFRVLLAAAGLDTYLESRIEVQERSYTQSNHQSADQVRSWLNARVCAADQ